MYRVPTEKMTRVACAFLCAILVTSILQPIEAKRNFGGGRHSYPKSGGLSGSGGGHHYPSSGGLSGGGHGYPSGGSHGYPSSGGLSGGGHGYPSSGGSHGYPSSGGSHGYPSSGGSHGYPAARPGSNSHGYPASGGLSGNSNSGQKTVVHNHYHYNPPQQIRYTPVHGGAPVSYPVYRGTPPSYVYQYKDSGSKYGTLLAGLGLLNLGVLAGGLYANSHSSHSNYKPRPGEVCLFGLKKENGDYEETKIDCQLISSFILAEEAKAQSSASNNTSVVTTTTTNVTVVNTTNGILDMGASATPDLQTNYTMLPNGTLVPVNVTSSNSSESANNSPSSSSMMSVVTTTTNTTTVAAVDVKGKPVEVTPGMQCYVIRNSPTSRFRKSVPCGLLQTYADKSLKRNSAGQLAPTFTIIIGLFAALISY